MAYTGGVGTEAVPPIPVKGSPPKFISVYALGGICRL